MSRLPWILGALCWAAVAAAQTTAVTVKPLNDVARAATGSAAASVLSPNDSVLAAEIAAPVAAVKAEVGSTMKKGQPILLLDATDARLALAQADAQLEAARARAALAEQRFERAQRLKEQQFVSDDEVLAAQTEHRAAVAQRKVAEAAQRVAARGVEKTRILAPFDGVVVERMAQVGALAVPGTPLLRIVDLSPPEIEAHVAAAEADGLADATDLAFEHRGERHPVKLLRLAPVVDAASRTRVARFAFTGEAAPAGSSGTLRWRAPTNQLPAALMVKRDGKLGAFVVRDGVARFVAAPGAQEGRPFAIALPANAQVVVEGQQGLTDGAAVEANSADGSR